MRHPLTNLILSAYSGVSTVIFAAVTGNHRTSLIKMAKREAPCRTLAFYDRALAPLGLKLAAVPLYWNSAGFPPIMPGQKIRAVIDGKMVPDVTVEDFLSKDNTVPVTSDGKRHIVSLLAIDR